MKTQRQSGSFLAQQGEEEDPDGPGEVGTWLFIRCATKELSVTGPNCPAV